MHTSLALAAVDSVLTDGQRGDTPLHSAGYNSDNQCEVAQILIAAGADLNFKNEVTVPCMPLTAADSVLTDGQGAGGIGPRRTPLALAEYFDQEHLVELLEAAGAR